ncbi:Transcription initiation factor TFIID [Corchorus capsularis]|uniref:Transcription initiation factor TFIID n=1 Tax=Corchorus capsularis TaxID=210143 RepID=A0A1R3IHS0_COCAP|nr:Transcription initiation factor TFIID [Corchorus capsularis]
MDQQQPPPTPSAPPSTTTTTTPTPTVNANPEPTQQQPPPSLPQPTQPQPQQPLPPQSQTPQIQPQPTPPQPSAAPPSSSTPSPNPSLNAIAKPLPSPTPPPQQTSQPRPTTLSTPQPRPSTASPTSITPANPAAFSRPWQQHSQFGHFSSSASSLSSSPSPTITPQPRGGIALGVPSSLSSPSPSIASASQSSPFSGSFGHSFGGASSSNVSQARPPMQGIGMAGSSIGTSSQIRPGAVSAHHQPRPVPSSIRPSSSPNSQSPATQNIQGHSLTRGSAAGTSASSSPSTQQASQSHQPWLMSGQQGKPPLPPPSLRPQINSPSSLPAPSPRPQINSPSSLPSPSLRPQINSPSLQQRAHIPQQHSSMPTVSHHPTVSQQQHVSSQQVPQPHVSSPQVPQPHVSSPQVPQSHVSSPQVPQSHVSSPQVTQPHVSSARVPQPRASSPHVPQPHVSSTHVPQSHVSSSHVSQPSPHQQEHFGQQFSQPRSITHQLQLLKAQGSANQRPSSLATVQSSTVQPVNQNKAAIVESDESGGRILSKRSIHDLVNQIDPSERLDPEVEDILVDIAEDFVDSITTFGCSLAKHRKSDTLEAKDILLHLERNWNMTLPGFSGDEIKTYKKPFTNEIHKERLAAIKKSIAVSDAANSKHFVGQGAVSTKGNLGKAAANILGSPNVKIREVT